MRKFLLLATALSLSACVGPDYEQPVFSMPDHWPWEDAKEKAVTMPAEELAEQVDWWKNYNDPALSALVDEALSQNADLLTAAARVSEARAILGLRQAERLPELSLQGSATRTRNSGETIVGGTFRSSDKPYNAFSLAGVLDFEIDLWGRLARASESARAQLLAQESNQDAVRLSVISETALAYFNLRALDEQLLIAQNTVKSREEAFGFQQKLYNAEAIAALTLRQSEAELAVAKAALPQIEQRRVEQQNALAVLLGRSPKAIVEEDITRGENIDLLPVSPIVPKDMPSTLLTRRPDIQAAEQNLVSANADIGVVRADYFPRISLSSLLGLSSSESDRLLRSSARNWQIGADLAAPIIDFGRVSSNVEAAEARKTQAEINYAQTVRSAFRDVLNAYSALNTATAREAAQTQQVQALSEAFRLAQIRYDAGYSAYIDVLDAQRGLFNAQLDRASAQADRLNASVNLYRALGGGWDELPKAVPPVDEPQEVIPAETTQAEPEAQPETKSEE